MVKELGKWSCNFGIKDALVKEPQIIGPGDCLPKHMAMLIRKKMYMA